MHIYNKDINWKINLYFIFPILFRNSPKISKNSNNFSHSFAKSQDNYSIISPVAMRNIKSRECPLFEYDDRRLSPRRSEQYFTLRNALFAVYVSKKKKKKSRRFHYCNDYMKIEPCSIETCLRAEANGIALYL